ncbi:MAG: NUDIX domain-containing protein [Saprospiraceae bacterium]
MFQQNLSLTVDAVVFGYDAKDGLSVLLIKRLLEPFKGQWAIPGGFLLAGESLEKAVERELEEETGIKVNYLEQLYTFGKPDRDPRKHIVTVAYYGLVRRSLFKLYAATDAEDAQWFNINELPSLAFDHADIFKMALDRLRGKIAYQPIGFELLEEEFPLPDLHRLYETLYGQEIDRRNFSKKILQLDILEDLNKFQSHAGRGRPSKLYKFNRTKYFALKEKGMVFEV